MTTRRAWGLRPCLTMLVLICLQLNQLSAQEIVFRESFATDGDGTRYTMFGRGADTSPDTWEHTFAIPQSTAFPLGPGGEITLAAPRMAIPWHSSINNATADAFPFFDSAVSWATGDGSGLNVSFLAKDGATAGNLDPGDAALLDRLTNTLGHTVNVIDTSSATPEGIGASGLLLVSDSVNEANIYRSFNIRDVQVPVINYDVELTDDLLLTTGTGNVRQLQSFNVGQPNSPSLPTGLTQDQLVNLTAERAMLPEYAQARPGVSTLATYQGPFARNVSNLATVDAMINGTAGSTIDVATIEIADLVDSSDPAAGIWADNLEIPGGGGNDFAVVSRGTITVSKAGDYVFGVGGDDGGRLRIDGQDVVVDDATHGFRYETGTVNLTEGDHDIEWVGLERSGGAGFELSFSPAENFLGTINVDDSDVISTAPFFEEIKLKEPGLETTAYYLDVEASPDGPTNNPAILAAAAGTHFSLPSKPFGRAVGDYILGTDMDSIPGADDTVPPGSIEFNPIDLSGVADPKLTLNVAGAGGMEEEGSFTEGVVIFVNDEQVAELLPGSLGLLEDARDNRFVLDSFQSFTWDLPDNLAQATIRIEVGNDSSGEAIGIDELLITSGDPNPEDVLGPIEVPDNRIQHGVNGYEGVVDTEIRFSAPDADNSELTSLNPDAADGGGEVHVLLRFDDLLGDGENQIPVDQLVEEATLNIVVTGPGSPLSLHRMLQEWQDDTATWNVWGNGIQADDVEAASQADDTQTANAGTTTWDITESIKAWQADPDSNFGWAMLPTGNNGVDFLSSEAVIGDLDFAPYIDFILGVAAGIPGDVDGNGEVAFADFLILSANFGQTVAAGTLGDIDGNGEVAFADFLVLSANFGQTAGAAAAVPEPSSIVLGLLAVLGLTMRRRRAR